MSFSKNVTEESEKQRIWKLEEQLEVEQHAHKMTRFALRRVQEQLEQNGMEPKVENSELVESLMRENGELKRKLKEKEEEINLFVDLNMDHQNLRTGSEDEILDLDKLMEKHRLESLQAENEDLKETLKTRDEKIGELERQMTNLQRISEEKKNTIDKLKMEINELEGVNKTLMENLESVKEELKIQLVQQSEKTGDVERRIEGLVEIFSDLEKVNEEAVESMKVLESERDELKVELEDNKTRLEECEKEAHIKGRIAWCCVNWIVKYSGMIHRLISVMKETNSRKYSEEVGKLEEDKKKAADEGIWWAEYIEVCANQTIALASIKFLRKGVLPDQFPLEKVKKSHEETSERLRRRKGEKEWIEVDLESKHLDIWEQLLMEAMEKKNKP